MRRLWIFCLLFGVLGTLSNARAAVHEVRLSGLSFSPAELTIEVGDTVRWINQGGFHDVVADDDSFRSGAPTSTAFVFERVFSSAGTFGYYCSVHGSPGAGMAGRIIVQGGTAGAPAINRGIDGSWFNPATDGQGFLVEVAPAQTVFAFAWFTWTDTGGYDWMIGNGLYEGSVAQLSVFRSRGGRFNNPAFPVTTTPAGDATFTLIDCTHARFDFTTTDPVRSGSILLTKILPPGSECVNPTVNVTTPP